MILSSITFGRLSAVIKWRRRYAGVSTVLHDHPVDNGIQATEIVYGEIVDVWISSDGSQLSVQGLQKQNVSRNTNIVLCLH